MEIDRLLEIKEKIEQGKLQIAKIEGTIQSLSDQLRTQFGCNSVEQAEQYSKKMIEEYTKKKRELERGVEELENAYDW